MDLKNWKTILKTNKLEYLFLIFVLFITVFLRFSDLGYSHFYGDETKTLYLRKDVSAKDFLFNQRKGPVQFLATWTIEKLTGGFDEAAIRFPFALAGTFSVFVFYLLLKKLYGKKAAIFSTLLFSINGFYVAFSRTAQYQSFLVFFGLLALLFLVHAFRGSKYTKLLLVISSLSLGLSLLSHYDAVFFAVPYLLYMLKEYKVKSISLKSIFLFIVLPLLAVVGVFYVPYIVEGYFSDHTLSYLLRRASGTRYKKNSSMYTYTVYNGFIVPFIPLAFALLSYLNLKKRNFNVVLAFVWFLVPFVVFEVLFSNPGTHIHNYFLPLLVLAGVGFSTLYDSYSFKKLLLGFSALVLLTLFIFSTYFYVPSLNTGYPWKDSTIGPLQISKIDNSYHLFLYGFPYYRGWDKVQKYFIEHGMPRSFYTNDNTTIGSYYLHGISVKALTETQLPEYFIDIGDNQLFEYKFAYSRQYRKEYSCNVINKSTCILYKHNKSY